MFFISFLRKQRITLSIKYIYADPWEIPRVWKYLRTEMNVFVIIFHKNTISEFQLKQ